MARRIKKIGLDEVEAAESDPVFPMEQTAPIVPRDLKVNEWVYVILPQFSPKLRAMMGEQYRAGKVARNQLMLSDGTVMAYDRTYLVRATPEVKDLLVRGILKGGGRARPPTQPPDGDKQ